MAKNVINPQHVSAASAFLDCAELALKAKALGDEKNSVRQTNTAEDTRIPLLHAAMQVLGLACNCDVDHGQLWTSSMTQHTFGQGEAVDETRDSGADEALAVRAVDSVLAFLAARNMRAAFPVTVSWVWDVTRAFFKKQRRIVCRRTVPVAGTDEHGGFLAELVLDVLEPGGGGVFHAHQDAFHTHTDARFISAMQDAWRGACTLVHTQETAAHAWDGRWQLQFQKRPHAEANDRSASGAAAWVWWHALTNKVLDERVIVVAQVDENNIMQLRGVDGIAAKTRAIVAAHRFDTIVVASAANKGEAEHVIAGEGPSDAIRVVIPEDQ